MKKITLDVEIYVIVNQKLRLLTRYYYSRSCKMLRTMGAWGQCYKPGDMMMDTNHLTKTKDELS